MYNLTGFFSVNWQWNVCCDRAEQKFPMRHIHAVSLSLPDPYPLTRRGRQVRQTLAQNVVCAPPRNGPSEQLWHTADCLPIISCPAARQPYAAVAWDDLVPLSECQCRVIHDVTSCGMLITGVCPSVTLVLDYGATLCETLMTFFPLVQRGACSFGLWGNFPWATSPRESHASFWAVWDWKMRQTLQWVGHLSGTLSSEDAM